MSLETSISICHMSWGRKRYHESRREGLYMQIEPLIMLPFMQFKGHKKKDN